MRASTLEFDLYNFSNSDRLATVVKNHPSPSSISATLYQGEDLEQLQYALEALKKNFDLSKITSISIQDDEEGYIDPAVLIAFMEGMEAVGINNVAELLITFSKQPTNHDNEMFLEDNLLIAKSIAKSFPKLKSLLWNANDGPGEADAGNPRPKRLEYVISNCKNLEIISFWGPRQRNKLCPRLSDNFLDSIQPHLGRITHLMVPDQNFTASRVKSFMKKNSKLNFVHTPGPDGILNHPRLK